MYSGKEEDWESYLDKLALESKAAQGGNIQRLTKRALQPRDTVDRIRQERIEELKAIREADKFAELGCRGLPW